jgi:hypothetical protein
MPWRRNITKDVGLEIDDATRSALFADVSRIRLQYPSECLASDDLWSDFTERANAVTRDRATNTLCHTLGIYLGDGTVSDYYCLRENSEALLTSLLYREITRLTEPFERSP